MEDKTPDPDVEVADVAMSGAYREVARSLLSLSQDLHKQATIYMDASQVEDELDRLHQVIGFSRLPAIWSKLEIFLGLVAVWCSFALADAVYPALLPLWLQKATLFVLGGYLTLAGHRSHLYRSMNKLTAYLRLKND